MLSNKLQLKTLGLQSTQSIDLVRDATARMTAEDTAAILVKSKLKDSEKILILKNKELTESEAEKLLAQAASTTATKIETQQTNRLTIAKAKLKAAVKGLTAAMRANSLTATLSIAAAVITAITGIASLVKKQVKKHNEELKQKADEVTSTYKEQTEALKNTKEKLDDLSERYEALSKGVDEHNKNISLTNAEYDEYLNICNQIGDMIPSLIQGFDNQGNAILKCKGNVEELTKAYEENITS